MTYKFKDTSFLENTPQLKTIFFRGISAKDFLLQSLDDEHELNLVRACPSWGLEPGVIWVLSKHFNVIAIEKKGALVASLIEDLDIEVRKYLNTIEVRWYGTDQGVVPKAPKKRRLNPPESGEAEPPITGDSIKIESEEKPDQVFAMGRIMLNWLLNKEWVSIYQSDVVIKTADGYIMQPSYARALFDIKLLPLNATLPMVHPPLEWKNRTPVRPGRGQADQRRLGDLTGGYLYSDPKMGHGHSKEARALSSHDETNFDIHLHGAAQTRQLTSVLNKLQAIPFQINRLFLRKLREDWDQFLKYGHVLPKILDSINRREGLSRLHAHYMKDDDIQENFTFRELSKVLVKNITEANYQQYILQLAEAYQGYYMYFPCFMDFRGRNYRYGPFHFHERDLVRSLIVFGDPGDIQEGVDYAKLAHNHMVATAFHFVKNSPNYSTAIKVFTDIIKKEKLLSPNIDKDARDCILYNYALRARNPFQFLSFFQMITSADDKNQDSWYYIMRAPHQLDASASAYQLISYFLLDLKMARDTNLFVDDDPHDQIHDIYQTIDSRLKEYIPHYSPPKDKTHDKEVITNIVNTLFDRKIVKKIFMPIVYGKTQFSAAKELAEQIGRYTSMANIYDLTRVCFKYWEKDFAGMKNLMKLVASISWVAAAIQQPVVLSNKYWVTHQDYFVKKAVRVTLRYKSKTTEGKAKAARAAVTLRLPTEKRNTRKSASSTFANFIHQKDGLTAINFILMMMNFKNNPDLQNLKLDLSRAPIYTVHDNFITTPLYANYLPYLYRRAIRLMGHPLTMVNKLVFDNIIAAIPTEDAPPTIRVELEALRKNYSRLDPRESSPISEDILEYCFTTHYKILKNRKDVKCKKVSKKGWDARKNKIVNKSKLAD